MVNDFKQTSLYKDVPLITSDKTSYGSRRVGDVKREEIARDINVTTK